jgi:hypothetical protein
MVFKNSAKRHIIVIIVFVFHSALSVAQTKFFINPFFTTKMGIGFVDPSDLNIGQQNILENQTFYMPYVVSENSRIVKQPTYRFGLAFGISYKNDTRNIQLSYNRDNASRKASSYMRAFNDTIHYGFGAIDGVGLHRITLNYNCKLSKENSAIQTWFSIGAGTFINKTRFVDPFAFSWYIPLSPTGVVLTKTYMQRFEETKMNVFLKIGFDTDFMLKQKYLFSLNAYYIQGFGVISRIEYVHEYLINNEPMRYGVGLMSRGSGFYLELSRRINVYPWKKKRD